MKSKYFLAWVMILILMAVGCKGGLREKKTSPHPPSAKEQQTNPAEEKGGKSQIEKEKNAESIEMKSAHRHIPPEVFESPSAAEQFYRNEFMPLINGMELVRMAGTLHLFRPNSGLFQSVEQINERLKLKELNYRGEYVRNIAEARLSVSELISMVDAIKEAHFNFAENLVFATADELIRIQCRDVYFFHAYCRFLLDDGADFIFVRLTKSDVRALVQNVEVFLNRGLSRLEYERPVIIVAATHWIVYGHSNILEDDLVTLKIFCDAGAVDVLSPSCALAMVGKNLPKEEKK